MNTREILIEKKKGSQGLKEMEAGGTKMAEQKYLRW